MQDKQKVTLYLSPELHRQLKIRAAIDSEPMSSIAERAIIFYLTHPEVIDEIEASYGQTHRVYSCPECKGSVVIQQGDLVSLNKQPGVLAEEELSVEKVTVTSGTDQQEEQELVPC
ncbi:hypothetical protein [Argonema antarcticum]|uniref:hypothetical protein n=1 Tax=Argonema antarcticum TaxID=2942763 RepID=UPI0020113F32|nr:hypothetical protein [Argonema antarcticum]MCL1471212.1 hypothetical protein [Argonema antarcticum A004/B2]